MFGFFNREDRAMEQAVAADLMAFAVQTEKSIVDKAATVAERMLADAREAEASLVMEIEYRQEQLRQTRLVIAAFTPTVPALTGYDSADDARKSYEVAIEAKRKRGDKHWPKRASEKTDLVAAE